MFPVCLAFHSRSGCRHLCESILHHISSFMLPCMPRFLRSTLFLLERMLLPNRTQNKRQYLLVSFLSLLVVLFLSEKQNCVNHAMRTAFMNEFDEGLKPLRVEAECASSRFSRRHLEKVCRMSKGVCMQNPYSPSWSLIADQCMTLVLLPLSKGNGSSLYVSFFICFSEFFFCWWC